MNSIKIENVNCGGLIEIIDSDDEEDSQEPAVHPSIELTDEHVEMAGNGEPPGLSTCDRNPNGVYAVAYTDSENEAKPAVGIKPDDDALKMVDLPLVVLDLNKANDV